MFRYAKCCLLAAVTASMVAIAPPTVDAGPRHGWRHQHRQYQKYRRQHRRFHRRWRNRAHRHHGRYNNWYGRGYYYGPGYYGRNNTGFYTPWGGFYFNY